MNTQTNMKVGDTAPPLTITCYDGTQPVNFTAAMKIIVNAYRSDTLLFSRQVTGDAAGVATMPWQDGDTSQAGPIYVDVTVTWNDNTVQTFPADGFLTVIVQAQQP